jgi:hypothetical protein
MKYVKTDGAGNVEIYPYLLSSLKKDNLSVSFPSSISDELAASYNVFPVTTTPQPAYDYTTNLTVTPVNVSGAWIEQWVSTPASVEEIETRTRNEESAVRMERDSLLLQSDWTQLPDSPLDADGKLAWALYRETLRLIPQQADFPWNVQWPPQPS